LRSVMSAEQDKEPIALKRVRGNAQGRRAGGEVPRTGDARGPCCPEATGLRPGLSPRPARAAVRDARPRVRGRPCGAPARALGVGAAVRAAALGILHVPLRSRRPWLPGRTQHNRRLGGGRETPLHRPPGVPTPQKK
jgi:hypothetical protein